MYKKLLAFLFSIDRRVISVVLVLALAVSLVLDFSLPPARMKSAEDFFKTVQNLPDHSKQLVLISLDWGPSTQAENRSQTEVAIEHLMRKRIPFGVITTYPHAAPFLELVPKSVAEKLMHQLPDQKWEYGKDWVNFGFRPGGFVMIQSLAKSQDIHQTMKSDASGTPLSDIPCMQNVHQISDISLLMEFTGLVGVFNTWVQFFQSEKYRPAMLHGCTSITIPEAYIYYVSKQILGLFEGVAGAAWYEELLSREYQGRKVGGAVRINTTLAVAHLVIIVLMIIGNISLLIGRIWSRR
jgi:hypothetical protein